MEHDLSYIAEQLRPLAVPIESLNLDLRNARSHDDRNLAAIRGSLMRFGQRKPVVARPDGTVIAGNGVLTCAREMGWTHIARVEFDASDADATAFAIADNRTGDLSKFNDKVLAELLKELSDEFDDWASIGYLHTEVDTILAEAGALSEGFEGMGRIDPAAEVPAGFAPPPEPKKNENWFYIEFYDDPDTFAELAALLKPYMVKGAHVIDSNFFTEAVRRMLKPQQEG